MGCRPQNAWSMAQFNPKAKIMEAQGVNLRLWSKAWVCLIKGKTTWGVNSGMKGRWMTPRQACSLPQLFEKPHCLFWLVFSDRQPLDDVPATPSSRPCLPASPNWTDFSWNTLTECMGVWCMLCAKCVPGACTHNLTEFWQLPKVNRTNPNLWIRVLGQGEPL